MIQLEHTFALHLDLYNYSCNDYFSAVEHDLNNKKFKYYKAEMLLDCCLY